MLTTTSGLTVADQVAALPPLAQLLGMDPPGPEATAKLKKNVFGKSRAHGRAPKANEGVLTLKKEVTTTPLTVSPDLTLAALAKELDRSDAGFSALPSSEKAKEGRPVAESTSAALQLPSEDSPGGLREWRKVQQSLQLPIAYRAEEDVLLSVRLLKTLPLLAPLVESDLLTLVETMSIIEVKEAGTVLLRKPYPQETVPSTRAALSTVDVTDHLPSLHATFSFEESLPQSNYEGEGTRPAWAVPASELFQNFREQRLRGEKPSLPLGWGGDHLTDLSQKTGPETQKRTTAEGICPPITVEKSSKSGGHRLQRQSSALQRAIKATPPLFVPDEYVNGGAGSPEESAFALVMLSGRCHVEWPRRRNPLDESGEASTWQRYELQPGDAMGYTLLWGALPPATQYVTTETCLLLVINAEEVSDDAVGRLRRVCRRVNEAMLREQSRFLAERLRVDLFHVHTTSPEEGLEITKEGERGAGETSLPHPATKQGGLLPMKEADLSKAAVPSVAALLEKTARQLIPVRLPTHAVLFREGLTPQEECALYFVREGGLSVVRRIWSADQQRLLAERAQLVKALTPPTGICPPMSSLPATDSMEVAQLRPGDYCGDLAYLDEDSDHVAHIDVEWTDAYWRGTLAQGLPRSSASAQQFASECTAADRGKGEGGGGTAPEPVEELTEENKSVFRRHKGTVVAQQASVLYVLSSSAADETLLGVVRERMLHHARTAYTGYRKIFQEYEKLFQWALYKERMIHDVSKKIPVGFR